MKTVCVTISNISSPASICDYIPQVVEYGDTRFLFLNSSGTRIQHSDASIESFCVSHPVAPFQHGTDIMGLPYVRFTRLDKGSQHSVLSKVSEGLDVPKFKKLQTIRQDLFNSIIMRSDKVIIKPKFGARSIGQFIFNPIYTPPAAISNIIAQSQNELDMCDKIEMNYPDVKYLKGYQREENEGHGALKSGIVCQEVIENIDAEFRIITGASGLPVIIKHRERVKVAENYMIPTSNPDTPGWNKLNTIYPIVHEQLCTLLKVLKAPFHSIDLFITKTGEWGIFEFSPEFTDSEYGPNALSKEAVLFLNEYLK